MASGVFSSVVILSCWCCGHIRKSFIQDLDFNTYKVSCRTNASVFCLCIFKVQCKLNWAYSPLRLHLGAWRVDCLHRNPKEHSLFKMCVRSMLSVSLPVVFCVIIQPLGNITSRPTLDFLQLKYNLFSCDGAADSLLICLFDENICLFWHISLMQWWTRNYVLNFTSLNF